MASASKKIEELQQDTMQSDEGQRYALTFHWLVAREGCCSAVQMVDLMY
jgi:hypothetical protein